MDLVRLSKESYEDYRGKCGNVNEKCDHLNGNNSHRYTVGEKPSLEFPHKKKCHTIFTMELRENEKQLAKFVFVKKEEKSELRNFTATVPIVFHWRDMIVIFPRKLQHFLLNSKEKSEF